MVQPDLRPDLLTAVSEVVALSIGELREGLGSLVDAGCVDDWIAIVSDMRTPVHVGFQPRAKALSGDEGFAAIARKGLRTPHPGLLPVVFVLADHAEIVIGWMGLDSDELQWLS
jgi:hypothetical protein